MPAVALDQAPRDTRKHSKGNYFPLSCPPGSSSHKEHSSLPILTEALETACIVLESQMIEGAGFYPLIHFQLKRVSSLPLNVFGSISCRIGGLYRDKQLLSFNTKGVPVQWPCRGLLENAVDGAWGTKAA